MKIIVQTLTAALIFLIIIPAVICYAGRPGQKAENFSADEKNIEKANVPETIDVWITSENKTCEVDFEEYICNVVASEMPGTFEEEALKAQSVAARTYAVAKIVKYSEKKPEKHPESPICDSTHCQVYKSEEQLIDNHESGWEQKGFSKIKAACKATEGELLYYDGELVMQPLFFSSSGGQTENSEDVFAGAYPYLVSVSSPYEEKATHRNEETAMSISDLKKTLKKTFKNKDFGSINEKNIKILSRTAGGRVDEIQVGNEILKGTEIRNALGLSSALFTISFESGNEWELDQNKKIVFVSSGSGHGVGMSQYGANGMAEEGYNYKEILKHYYTGTEVY